MLKFYITPEERKQAQKRAAELHLNHTDPPGQHPFVWDVALGMVGVDYWYDYGSAESKICTIWFHTVSKDAGRSSQMIECTTEITHRPLVGKVKAPRVSITDFEEHEKLRECFFRELLGRAPGGQEAAVPDDITALKKRIEELDALNHVATILNSTHDLQSVLELALERIGAALHAEAGFLLLRDDATGELVFAVAQGPAADRLRGRRLAPGQGIAGWVTKSGEAVITGEARVDPRFSGVVDKASGFVTHSVLCAPLRTSQGIIGVVQVLNHVEGRPFSRADLQLLETMALHAASVIERARLLERERELTALLAMSNMTGEFSGPLESLESCLINLSNTSHPQDPNVVAIIEKAVEHIHTIRKLFQLCQHLSSALPEDSSNTTSVAAGIEDLGSYIEQDDP